MSCRSCPYIKNEYDLKTQHEYKLFMCYPGYEDDMEQSCWCEKVGGKIYQYGDCGERYPMDCQKMNHTKKKKQNKRERDLKYKNHLKYIADHVPYYPSGVDYVDEEYIKDIGYVQLNKPYYKRIYRSNHGGSKRLKSFSNRCVRRYKGDLQNGGSYKKIFDYWYTLY